MAKFIELRQDNSSDVFNVNVDHIVRFHRGPGFSYTVVEMTPGISNMTVKETPEEIRKAIAR
jgi:hypothetical protein